MGLLDEAIREHLELRRQHGADPDEVAREERAALTPPRVDEDRETVEASLNDEVAETRDDDGEAGESGPDSPGVVQETVEIDMRTVLDGHDADGGEDLEDDEAWETPKDRGREARAVPVVARIDPLASTPDVEDDPPEAPAKRGRLFKRRPPRS